MRSACGFTPLLRNLLAEELYLSGNSKSISIPQGGQESVARVYVTPNPSVAAALALADFADCITFADPADADALLRTGPATADERADVGGLMPALSACVVAGQNLTLTPGSIRFRGRGRCMWSRYHYGTKIVKARRNETVDLFLRLHWLSHSQRLSWRRETTTSTPRSAHASVETGSSLSMSRIASSRTSATRWAVNAARR